MRCRILVLLVVLFTPNVVLGEQVGLTSNGYAKHSELGNELYIGALFLEKPTNDPSEIRSMAQKRMEIKVVAEKFSYRRFKRNLVKNAALNNSQEVLIANAGDTEEFLRWFRSNLAFGDHIVMATNEVGFELTVNSVRLTTIESPALFNILLNTWIGSVPPSRDFKMQILGRETNTQVAADFDELNHVNDRVNIVEGWKTELEEIALQAEIEARLQAEAQEAELRAEQNRLRQIARREQERLQQLAEEEEQRRQAAAELARLAATVPPALPLSDAENLSGSDKLVVVEASNTGTDIQPDSGIAEAPEVDDEFSAENLLAAQVYTSKLLIHSRKNMEYPIQSRRLGHQDTIMASITIDRRGRLVEYVLTEESKHSPLNSEVKKGIRRSAPFPRIPKKISGDTYTFQLPVTFKLNN